MQRLHRAHTSERRSVVAPSATLASPVVFLRGGDASASARPSTRVDGGQRTRARKRRRWPSYARREEILGSAAAYLVSFAICFVALGFGAYFYAQWTLGLT
jgi:hypothetical protein